MKKSSQELILSLKQMEGSQLFIIMKFIKEKYQLNESQVFMTDVERVVRETVLDYLESCDNIKAEVRRLFDAQNYIAGLDNSNLSILCRFLVNIRVRDKDGNYINGFDEETVKKFEERKFHFKIPFFKR